MHTGRIWCQSTESRVNYHLSSNHTYYLAQSLCTIVYILLNFHRNFANLVAPPTDRTEKYLVHFKVPLVLYQMAKTTSKSMHYWRCYPSSNWYKIDQKMRF